ncbi:MAG: endolytic transglycosylase MltG [Oscillospiraceae bacterium]|nr:endolytic transglycosylase MltG [Oscillospiraceae bacterium]
MSERKNSETTSWNAGQVRRETNQQARKSKKKRSRGVNALIYVAGVILSSCLLAGIGWLMVNDVCALNKEPLEVTLRVEKGDTVGDVATKLKNEGLIESKFLFKIFAGIFDAKDIIAPGTYELDTTMDFHCLINSMQETMSIVPPGVVQVTIPEGYTVKQTIALLAENGVCAEDKLLEVAKNYVFAEYDFVDNTNLGDVSRLEGYLAPDTYEFFEDEAPERALSRLLDNFSVWMTADMRQDILNSPYNLHEIVVMASLIEKEAIGDDEERKNIASVLYNRMEHPEMETGGLLQLDSTIYYILRNNGRDDSEFSTSIDSPYNTYLYQGLPAGAICNPSRSALMAAVYPNDTDYYYFAYGVDDVSHFFYNYNEHLNFVNSDMYRPD